MRIMNLKYLIFPALMTALFSFVMSPSAQAEAVIGEPAPLFEAKSISGETIDLEAYRGKSVVLEWSNHQCPYVIKHYDTGNMQELQKQARANEVVWLTIVSSAKGKQGHTPPEKAKEIVQETGSHATARIMDESGDIGRIYGAKTTPHMFVINPEGTLVYEGAIDSNSSPRHSAVEGATNYVSAALEALEAGKPVDPASTQPYGCSVKYGS